MNLEPSLGRVFKLSTYPRCGGEVVFFAPPNTEDDDRGMARSAVILVGHHLHGLA